MPTPVFCKEHTMFQITTSSTESYSDALPTSEVKEFLRVDNTDEDTLIGVLRDAAVQHCEAHTGRYFRSTAIVVNAPDWHDLRRLPIGPLSGTITLLYFKENASTSTVLANTEYTSNLLGDVLHVNYRNSPPVADPYRFDAVNLTTTGGTAAASIPENVKIAALMLVGHWFENRYAVHIGSTITEMPLAVTALLAQYRLQ